MEFSYSFKKARESFLPQEEGGFGKSAIPNIKGPAWWICVIHKHDAKRAGLHYDLRLGPPGEKLYSWAIRKGLPKHGEKFLATRTSDHDPEWANFTGKISSGYGAGRVDIWFKGGAEILEASPQKIKFAINRNGTQEYTLIHTGGDKWLIINSTPTDKKYKIPNHKPKMKEIDIKEKETLAEILVEDPRWIATPKFDGIHSLLYIQPGKQIRVFSKNKPKYTDTGLIEYTHKIPGIIGERAPKDVPEMIIRAELFGTDKKGDMVPVHQITKILHTKDPVEAEVKRRRDGVDLKLYPFDLYKVRNKVVEDNEPYEKKLEIIARAAAKLPDPVLPPIIFTDKNEKRKVIDDIRFGDILKDTRFSEGSVFWDITKPQRAVKVKRKIDKDVYIQEIKPGTGQRSGEAGSIGYSFEPNGEIVGYVNTAPLPKKMREDMLKHPQRFKNVALRIRGLGFGTYGSLRQPVIAGIHEDKTMEQGKLEDVMKYL